MEMVAGKTEKRIKPKSKKGKENEENDTGMPWVENIEGVKQHKQARIHEQSSMKEDAVEMKSHKDKKKKEKEKKKVNDTEKGKMEEEDAGKAELRGVYRYDSIRDTKDNAERKKMMKMERKKYKKQANSAAGLEIGKVDKVDADAGQMNLDTHNLTKMKAEKKADKEKKKNQKVKIDSKDGEFEQGEKEARNEDDSLCENYETDIADKVERKKRKREGTKIKDDSMANETLDNKVGKMTKKKLVMDGIDRGDTSVLELENAPKDVEDSVESTRHGGSADKKSEKKNKFKKKRNFKDDSSVVQQDVRVRGLLVNDSKALVNTGEVRDKKVEHVNPGKMKREKFVEIGSHDPTPGKSNKKVRFSGQIEVLSLPENLNAEGNDEEVKLVKGKRFTREEDEILKAAVWKYIEEHDLGEEGLHMVLNCQKYPELRGCWKKIVSAIPYRPYNTVNIRAQLLFRRSEIRKWTEEEKEMILRFQKQHGNKWTLLANDLGKHRWHVKDTWRRIKFENLKKGRWSQEEYQKLFDLVNADLQLKVSEEKRSKHGMLRDNIGWTAISDELGTRDHGSCCIKWYRQLTSRMVSDGTWVDSDDYRLVGALYSTDANCMEDVDWDDLVEGRAGDVCRKRWNQMVLHIGHHGLKSFAEQVETLAQRYCPYLLEARVAWDSKPRVP